MNMIVSDVTRPRATMTAETEQTEDPCNRYLRLAPQASSLKYAVNVELILY